jgi:predicted ABC-type ATPase
MKRMRVFAGPNGSGKSTMVRDVIEKGHKHYGRDLIDSKRHINPDEINSNGVIDFSEYGLAIKENDFRSSMMQSPFFKQCNINIEDFIINNNCFTIPKKNSYIGSMLADYLRDCYIKSNEKLFSFETVFSHPSKVDFLETANGYGWEVYLYFVSTVDPYINCDRVRDRVLKGGHDVPNNKVIERYTNSLNNLYPALKHCRRAYIFDNTKDMELIAEINPNSIFEVCGSGGVKALWLLWLYEHVISKCQISIH